MKNYFFTKKRAYLDWASAAPIHPAAQKAFSETLNVFGNPSSPHEEGRTANKVLEVARLKIARLAGVKQSDVIFTSGATEANAIAVRGRIERCRQEGMAYADMHVLYLPTMHASVVQNIEAVAELGVAIEPITLANEAIDLKAFSTQLRVETVLVCADAICGETGVRFDTLRLKRAMEVAKHASKALLHVDASQLPLVESIERTRLGADLLSLDAQKVGGIRGIGALIIPHTANVTAIMQGGGQEQGLRPGTEPVALAAAFAAVLEVRAEESETFAECAREARAALIASIQKALPSALVNEGKPQAPHILNMSLPGYDTDYLVTLMDTAGIAVSTRSACETDSEDGSRAVYAFTGDADRAKATLRLSWGPETTSRDLRKAAEDLIKNARFLAGH